jgi:hypothetical protein
MRKREMVREMWEWEREKEVDKESEKEREREREQDGGGTRGRKRMREGGCQERGELNNMGMDRVVKGGRRGITEGWYMKTIYAWCISEVWKVTEKRIRVNELQEKWNE